MLTTSLTLGSSGSGGDLGPSLAIGALLGGAVGGALRLMVGPAIDVGAVALVSMTAFDAGLANAPIGALVLVCELTGTTDLIVPSMLASGLTYALLRGVDLYPAAATPDDRLVGHSAFASAGTVRIQSSVP